MELVAPVLVASLLGSAHCAAMCGPFVVFCTAGDPAARQRAHIAYHLGRAATYIGLGLAAGWLGSALDLAGERLLGVQRVAAGIAAGLMLLWGGVALLRALGVGGAASGGGAAHALMLRVVRGARAHSPLARAMLLGAATTLLPCGWLYAFVLAAAGTGSPARGAVSMLAFWVGTLPALALVGVALQRLMGPLRRHLAVASAVALLVIGGVGLARRVPTAQPTSGSCHGER